MVVHLSNPIMRSGFCPGARRLNLEANVYGKSPSTGSAGPLVPDPCTAYSAESMETDDLFYPIILKTFILEAQFLLCQETASSRH
jgi:hypothetical protein